MKGARARADREFDLLRFQVWHTAALARVERFPDFDKFAVPKRRKTADEMLSIARQWHAATLAQEKRGIVKNG